jgi:hypothetical protein
MASTQSEVALLTPPLGSSFCLPDGCACLGDRAPMRAHRTHGVGWPERDLLR